LSSLSNDPLTLSGDLQGLPLAPQHLALVADSRISPEVAGARSYRTVDTKAELETLGFARRQCRVPALLIGEQIGVPVAPFPRWMRCPRCDLLARLGSGVFSLRVDQYHPDRTRYVHSNCNKANEPPVLPVRFLLACRNGHLDDFHWVEYVHGGVRPSHVSILRLREFGVSGEASDIVVRCDTCGASRRMGDAVGPDAASVLPACRGRHPHLRTDSEDACPEPVRVILLGASNSWFPVTLSTLSIPKSDDRVKQLVDEHWHDLHKITHPIRCARSSLPPRTG